MYNIYSMYYSYFYTWTVSLLKTYKVCQTETYKVGLLKTYKAFYKVRVNACKNKTRNNVLYTDFMT